jgi:hypothetical protein
MLRRFGCGVPWTARHYVRYSVFFRTSEYNLAATTTNLARGGFSVSNIASGELITCASCEYRYPRSQGICPMCGTEPLRPLWTVPDEISRADRASHPSSSDSQQRPKTRLWRLIPVVVVLAALMAITSFFHQRSNGNLPKESSTAAEPTATSEQIKVENAGERDTVHDPVREVQHVVAGEMGTTLTAASEQTKLKNGREQDMVHDPVRRVQPVVTGKLGTARTTNAAKENDPVELWKAVKRGSVSAEVALATLYLEGEAVPQNCEQAHMLLHAASLKGSKAADDSLNGSYARRCE